MASPVGVVRRVDRPWRSVIRKCAAGSQQIPPDYVVRCVDDVIVVVVADEGQRGRNCHRKVPKGHQIVAAEVDSRGLGGPTIWSKKISRQRLARIAAAASGSQRDSNRR